MSKKRKLKYPDGGTIDPNKGTKVYTSPKEFSKAQKAYKDSLDAYKEGEEFFNDGDPTYGGMYQLRKVKNPGDYYYQATADGFKTRLKPQSFYEVNDGSDTFYPRWKKPVVKPVLEERNLRPNIDELQSKRYSGNSEDMDIVGSQQELPSTAPMSSASDGNYRVVRVSPYADPTYQVWTPTNKWKDVSKEEYDKISSEKYLTEYKYGGDMKKRKLKLTDGGFPFADALPTEWASDNSWAPNIQSPTSSVPGPVKPTFGDTGEQTFTPDTTGVLNAAGTALGIPGLGNMVQISDKVADVAAGVGQDLLAPKIGTMDQAEKDIAFKYSKKLDKIPILGTQVGTFIDMARNAKDADGNSRAGNQIAEYRLDRRKSASSDFTGSAKSFVMAKGGQLPFTEYEGLSHDEMDPMTGETGVQFDPHPDPNMPDIEVEGGETSFDGKVFTDREEYKKGVTFAAQSKKYNKELEMRPTDKISKNVAKKKLDRLFEIQEARKAAEMDKYSVMKADAMSSPYGEKIMAKYGGKIKMAGGGLPNGMETISVDNIMEMSGINQNELDLAQLGQLAAPIMQGVQAARDKDVVKFDRIKTPTLDTKTPVDILRQQSKEQVGTAASNIARNAGNQAQYLAARGALGARAASDLGRNVALMKSDLANKQAAMDFEGNKANTSIANAEKELMQNRKDFLRKMAIQATDATGTKIAGMAKDDAAFKADLFEEVTKANALGGEEFMYVFDPKDRKMKYIRRPK